MTTIPPILPTLLSCFNDEEDYNFSPYFGEPNPKIDTALNQALLTRIIQPLEQQNLGNPSQLGPLHIDGHIDSLTGELDIWKIFAMILSRLLIFVESPNAHSSPETLAFIELLQENNISTKEFSDAVNSLFRKMKYGGTLEAKDLRVLHFSLSLLEALASQSKSFTQHLYRYGIREIDVCLKENRGLPVEGLLDRFAGKNIDDISSDQDYKNFVKTLPQNHQDKITQAGIPFDFVSNGTDKPLQLVFVDVHGDTKMQNAIVGNFARFASTSPYIGTEAIVNGKPSHPDTATAYSNELYGESIRYYEKAVAKGQALIDQVDVARLDGVDMSPQETESYSRILKNLRHDQKQLYTLTGLHESIVKCDESELSPDEKMQNYTDIFNRYKKEEGTFSKVHLAELANLCLYDGAFNLVGYEDPATFRATDHIADFLRDNPNPSPEHYAAEYLIHMYRSRLAHDNSLDQMNASGKKLGLVQIGAAHYKEYHDWAKEQGKTNVIFIFTKPTDKMPPLELARG